MPTTPQTSWIDHPISMFFLPYYRRVELVDIHSSVVRERFIRLNGKSILNDASGALSISRKRYEMKATDDIIQIQGPYGYRAWTMRTTIAILSEGEASVLDVRTRPHWSVVLFTLFGFIFISAFSANSGFSGMPFFPILFFASFFYIAFVVATKIESASIEAIVRRISRDEPLNISY